MSRKLSFSARFTINFSIQNFSLFLVLPSVPLRIEKYQRKKGTETKWDLWGLPEYKSLSLSSAVCRASLVEKRFPWGGKALVS